MIKIVYDLPWRGVLVSWALQLNGWWVTQLGSQWSWASPRFSPPAPAADAALATLAPVLLWAATAQRLISVNIEQSQVRESQEHRKTLEAMYYRYVDEWQTWERDRLLWYCLKFTSLNSEHTSLTSLTANYYRRSIHLPKFCLISRINEILILNSEYTMNSLPW